MRLVIARLGFVAVFGLLSLGACGSGGAGAPATTAGSNATSGGLAGRCPPGPYAANPVPVGATAQRVAGVPPSDAFNGNLSGFGIVEGALWLDGALYVSEFGSGSTPASRILRVTPQGRVSVAIATAGTNGLALDPSGALLGANHVAGAVQRLSLTGGAAVDLVASYMGQRFNGPNDIAVRADGNLYFTDPDYQAPVPRPQSATRVYRVAPGANQATPLSPDRPQPNGITLSLDGARLYVAAQGGVFSHPVAADGSVGAGTRFGTVSGSDGFGLDCAGNLYTTTGMNVIVLNPMGTEIGRIAVAAQTTNVAFGGAEQKTLYVTTLGNGAQRGLFQVELAIPGMPY